MSIDIMISKRSFDSASPLILSDLNDLGFTNKYRCLSCGEVWLSGSPSLPPVDHCPFCAVGKYRCLSCGEVWLSGSPSLPPVDHCSFCAVGAFND